MGIWIGITISFFSLIVVDSYSLTRDIVWLWKFRFFNMDSEWRRDFVIGLINWKCFGRLGVEVELGRDFNCLGVFLLLLWFCEIEFFFEKCIVGNMMWWDGGGVVWLDMRSLFLILKLLIIDGIGRLFILLLWWFYGGGRVFLDWWFLLLVLFKVVCNLVI